MSISGLQNYTQPLSLLGDVTVKGNFNAKNVYVNGTLNGTGLSTNILNTNNTWTGTNTYTNTTSYTGSNPLSSDDDFTTKQDVDNLKTSYDTGSLRPTITDNIWTGTATFSNVVPPIIPSASVTNNKLVGYNEMVNFINTYQSIPSNSTNDIRGNNTFSLSPLVSTPSLLIPTQNLQLASKAYVDAKIEVSGKTLTYTITTPGTYNFSFVNKANIVGIEYMLFGASNGTSLSGSYVSGKIGNGNGDFGSLFLKVGSITSINYTNYLQDVASHTYLKSSSSFIANAGGSAKINGVFVSGSVINGDNSISYTGTCNGRSGNNLFAYSNILGTTTSQGGAVFVAYYI